MDPIPSVYLSRILGLAKRMKCVGGEVGKELFYTNEIKIARFMRSAIQPPSSYLSRSPLEFRRILTHDL